MNGSAINESDAAHIVALYNEYERIQQIDAEKRDFMTALLGRYEYLSQQYASLEAERRRNEEFVVAWQKEKEEYEKFVKSLARSIEDNSFVMVLIDGDGMIFNDDFLHCGEIGGRRAASQLSAAVQEHIQIETYNVPSNARIVCRVYANVTGLAEVLSRKGIIDDVALFEDFTRGFTRGKTHFDFVDVGAGKDRADEKIVASLQLFSQDIHCRKLFFGCSHDNGYARSLEEFSDRAEVVSKVVLLEGVPFEKELIPLPYRKKKLPGIFRESKIVLDGGPRSNYHPIASSMESPPTVSKHYSILPGLPTRFPAPSRPAIFLESPLPSAAALATTNMPRTPSSSTLASDASTPALKPATSWAAKAAAPAPSRSSSPAYKPVVRDEVIARNRAGQRIDPPCKSYDKLEVDRIKKLKMCNVHFLRAECPFNADCTHEHAHAPTADEIGTLRLVARMAPCVNGSACQDIKCIYGHVCPFPASKTHRKACIFGDACKFDRGLHDVDRNVVKTLVIR